MKKKYYRLETEFIVHEKNGRGIEDIRNGSRGNGYSYDEYYDGMGYGDGHGYGDGWISGSRDGHGNGWGNGYGKGSGSFIIEEDNEVEDVDEEEDEIE